MKFKEEDEKILNYIVLNLNRGDSFKIVEGKILRINEEYIEEILKLVSDNRKVKLNYDYINYESYIIKEDMPLSFTVKIELDKIILTTKKKLPIPLNDKFTVFLSDRKIYLPSNKQINSYKLFYYKLKSNGKVEYSKDEASINKLFNLLSNISKDIKLGEGVKNICRNYYKVKFYFKKENNNIKCKATVNYFGKTINILDKNINYFLRDNNFEEEISMKLERYRFIKKANEFLFIGNDEERYEFFISGLKFFEEFSTLEFAKSFNEVNLVGSNDIHAIFEGQDEELRFKYNKDGLE